MTTLSKTKVMQHGKGKLVAKKSKTSESKVSPSKPVGTPRILKDQLLSSSPKSFLKAKHVPKLNCGPSTSKIPTSLAKPGKGPSVSSLSRINKYSEKESTGSIISRSLLTHYENQVLEEVIPSSSFFEAEFDSKLFSEQEEARNMENLSAVRRVNQEKSNVFVSDADSSDLDIF